VLYKYSEHYIMQRRLAALIRWSGARFYH